MSSPRIYANGLNLGGVSYWNDDRPLIDCWRLHSTSLSSKGKYDPATGLPTGEDTQEVYAMLPVDVGGSFSYQYLINGPMLNLTSLVSQVTTVPTLGGFRDGKGAASCSA